VTSASTTSTALYFVLENGRERGPFEFRFIEAMVLAGQFPSSVQIRLASGVSAYAAGSDGKPFSPFCDLKEKKNQTGGKGKIVGFAVLCVVGVALFFNFYPPKKTSPDGKSSTYTRSTQKSSKKYPNTSPTAQTPPRSYRTEAPVYIPPPLPDPIPEDSILTGAFGKRYRVSQSDLRRLAPLEAEITKRKPSLDAKKEELSALNSELNRLRITLDNYSQYEVDSFNSKVEIYNNTREAYNEMVNEFNMKVDAYNSELHRVGRLAY
jgi:hypothetical protein